MVAAASWSVPALVYDLIGRLAQGIATGLSTRCVAECPEVRVTCPQAGQAAAPAFFWLEVNFVFSGFAFAFLVGALLGYLAGARRQDPVRDEARLQVALARERYGGHR